MNTLLTAEEVAKYLHVPLSWIYDRTRKSGPDKLPHYKIGKYLRFSLDEIDLFVSKKTVN